jgi:hypothetical protein
MTMHEVLAFLQRVPQPLPPLVVLLLHLDLLCDLFSPEEGKNQKREQMVMGEDNERRCDSLHLVPHGVQQSHEVVPLVSSLAFKVI